MPMGCSRGEGHGTDHGAYPIGRDTKDIVRSTASRRICARQAIKHRDTLGRPIYLNQKRRNTNTMARKRLLPYECYSCGKCFKSAQAVRGHRRHCRYPRLRRQAEAQAAAQPVPATRFEKRPGPLSQEGKLLALDAWEGLEQLQRAAQRFGTVANIMAEMNIEGHYEQAKEWAKIYWIMDDCLRDLDPMLPVFRLDRGVLFGMYTIIRTLKERWIEERVSSFFRPALEPDGLDEATRTMLFEEEAKFVRLIDQLKRLVVAAP